MANDSLELFTNKADFQNLIDQIDGQINVLEGIADEYEGMKTRFPPSWSRRTTTSKR